VRYFHEWYRRDGGARSDSWVKPPASGRGIDREKKKVMHRKKRERAPLPGMTIHRDGRRHEWVEGQSQGPIVTMDEATSEYYDMRFVEEEGTVSHHLGRREMSFFAFVVKSNTVSLSQVVICFTRISQLFLIEKRLKTRNLQLHKASM
jgi:hypothetical protein